MSPIYVSPLGDDAAAGTADRPFATLTRARDAARAGEDRHILVCGGAYHEVALVLEPADSGLTIEAAPGETPVLYGGRRVTGWQQEGDHLVSAPLPGVREGAWDFRALVVNGHLCPRARYPETGSLPHLSEFPVRWMSTTGGGWERKPTPEELTTMRFRDGDLGPWLDLRNAEMTVFHQWDESVVGVAALDEGTHTVTFSSPCGHPPGAFGEWNTQARTYVVWNIREGLTQPGQWYLDRTAGRLVYWPLPGEDMATAEVIAPTTERIIRLEGTADGPVTHVTLRGLTLAATTTPLLAAGFAAGKFDGALSADYAWDCLVEGLTVANVGGHGLKLRHCDRTRVAGCHIHTTGAGGLYCQATTDPVLAQNHIHHVGVAYPSAQGMNLSGSGHLVQHNYLHDTSYSAIGTGASQSRFEYNRFERFMQVLSDGAAIYNGFCNDVVIRGNVAYGASGTLAHAYYIDEQGENCVVEGNLAVNTRWPSHNHMARRCIIRDNVFVDVESSRITLMRCEGFIFTRNVIYSQGDITLSTMPEGIAAMPDNLFYSGTGTITLETLGEDGYTPVASAPLPEHDGTRFANPGFVDVEGGDYRYRADAIATEMGLQPVDVARAGLGEGASDV